MRFDLVIFDLDGTLLDTSEGIVESVKHAACELGFKQLPNDELLRFVGPPLRQSFIEHYQCSKETADAATSAFREYYQAHALFKARPYEGIRDLLEAINEAGSKVAVATNKPDAFAKNLLSHFGLDAWCSCIHGADAKGLMGKRDLVRLCVSDANCEAARSVLVGDTEHDALGAEGADVAFIAVTYGFGFKNCNDVEGHPHIGAANTAGEVWDILCKAK